MKEGQTQWVQGPPLGPQGDEPALPLPVLTREKSGRLERFQGREESYQCQPEDQLSSEGIPCKHWDTSKKRNQLARSASCPPFLLVRAGGEETPGETEGGSASISALMKGLVSFLWVQGTHRELGLSHVAGAPQRTSCKVRGPQPTGDCLICQN